MEINANQPVVTVSNKSDSSQNGEKPPYNHLLELFIEAYQESKRFDLTLNTHGRFTDHITLIAFDAFSKGVVVSTRTQRFVDIIFEMGSRIAELEQESLKKDKVIDKAAERIRNISKDFADYMSNVRSAGF